MARAFKQFRFIIVFLYLILWQFGLNKANIYAQANLKTIPMYVLDFAGSFILGLILFWAFSDKMSVRKSFDAKAMALFVALTVVVVTIMISIFTPALNISMLSVFFIQTNVVALQGMIMLNAILLANCIFTDKSNQGRYYYASFK
ncbi:MAG TPA: hypothetical protein VFD52_00310 [Clostridia bacterium]|nr:hypothetical protein [Clostridia bacterium]